MSSDSLTVNVTQGWRIKKKNPHVISAVQNEQVVDAVINQAEEETRDSVNASLETEKTESKGNGVGEG